jgi:translation elongation factor EF-4
MDMFVEQTHELTVAQRSNERPMRYTDTRVDEQARGISLKAVPMSLVMEGSSGKSYAINLIDTPGEHAGIAAADVEALSRDMHLFCNFSNPYYPVP